MSRYFPQRAQTQGLGGFLPLRSKGGSVPFAAGKDREKSRPFGQKKQKASPPKPRACLKNRKRRLFTQKGPLSASKILANRKIALRFFP